MLNFAFDAEFFRPPSAGSTHAADIGANFQRREWFLPMALWPIVAARLRNVMKAGAEPTVIIEIEYT